ncbi:aspartic peptidase domain-containing protein [Mycotypha africana]|uniref:aspartic peptidase domain-containing protein n=1 Tax=Mycotypha africana TaxID=64632 RepID=UPI0023015D78|nr:aspartic peptidase domain-containing protein [Mycotypha africana]KAI8969277.1 aspartic peptidase domain-containing protein [Mycotypha africana]
MVKLLPSLLYYLGLHIATITAIPLDSSSNGNIIGDGNKVTGKKASNNIITLPLIKSDRRNLSKRSNNKAVYELINERNIEYLAKVDIGSPPQEFLVSIDTGSADLWVPGKECPSNECPYDKFQPHESKTYKSMNLSFTIQYGSGSVHGYYGKDTINLSTSISDSNKKDRTQKKTNQKKQQTIPSQPFGVVYSTEGGIISKATRSDGILGLGFPALTANSDTPQAYDPFVFNLVKQKLISEPIFSITLKEQLLMIGGIDENQYTGDIHYVPVTKNLNPKTNTQEYTYWSVALKNMYVDGSKVRNSAASSVILDTGTTLSYVSQSLAENLVRSVTGRRPRYNAEAEMYEIDCHLKNKAVGIEFDNSVKLVIDIQELVVPIDAYTCGFGITYGFDSSDSTYVLGGTILRSAYFVFHMEDRKVGLATAINSPSEVIKA